MNKVAMVEICIVLFVVSCNSSTKTTSSRDAISTSHKTVDNQISIKERDAHHICPTVLEPYRRIGNLILGMTLSETGAYYYHVNDKYAPLITMNDGEYEVLLDKANWKVKRIRYSVNMSKDKCIMINGYTITHLLQLPDQT